MIDDIDKRILKALQQDCRRPLSELAEYVGLSLSGCHRRIGILEDKGLIESYGARLDGHKLGYAMTFYLEVSLESQSEKALEDFERAALLLPEVLECYLTTGQADYLIKVVARDTKDYEKIYRRTISTLPNISHIQSSLVMKTVKPWTGYSIANV